MTETPETPTARSDTKRIYRESDLARFIRLMDRLGPEQVEFMSKLLAECEVEVPVWELAFDEGARKLGMRTIPLLADGRDELADVDELCAARLLGPEWLQQFLGEIAAMWKYGRANTPDDLLRTVQRSVAAFYGRVEVAQQVLRDCPLALSDDIQKAAQNNPTFAATLAPELRKKGNDNAR